MATSKSLLKVIRHINKGFLSGRTFKLQQPNIQLLLSQVNKASNSTNCKAEQENESSKKDYEELEKLLVEKEKLLEDTKKEALDFKDKYVRSLAEGENIRRRGLKMASDTKLYAIQSLAKDLLEVADILEKATNSVPEKERKLNEHLDLLYSGVVMTEIQLHKVFKKHGLEQINPIDEVFDPNFHEALFQLPVPGKPSGVISAVQKIGYKLHGRPLRAAQVAVVP